MRQIHSLVLELGILDDGIVDPWNIVMYMHSLAIHKVYENESTWIKLMKQLLCNEMTEKHRDSGSFNRTLGLVLELLELDNKELSKELATLAEQCKKLVNQESYGEGHDVTISRGSKFYLMLLEQLGLVKELPDGTQLCQVEFPVAGGLLNSDFYVGGDFDLIIDIQGPTHFLNDGLLKNHIDSSLYT
jgi:hypothetical protein